jgi:hypothetical protein
MPIHRVVCTSSIEFANGRAPGDLAGARWWQKLLLSESALASSGYADATREALAMRIIDLATAGERDVNRLRDGAVAFVTEALQRKGA